MTILSAALAVLLFLAALAGHEYAHAAALRRFGIPISEAGLGLPFWPRLRRPVTWQGHKVTLSLSPWLLGAYVQAHPNHEDELDALRYRDKSWYLGAGITFNVVAGFTLAALALGIGGFWWHAAAAAVAALLITVFRRPFAVVVIPALGPLCFAAVAVGVILADPREPQGVAGVGKIVAAMPTDGLAWTVVLANVLELGAAINLGLAVLNTVPLYPLDAGRIYSEVISAKLGPRFNVAFQVFGMVCVVGLLAYSVATDVSWLAS